MFFRTNGKLKQKTIFSYLSKKKLTTVYILIILLSQEYHTSMPLFSNIFKDVSKREHFSCLILD